MAPKFGTSGLRGLVIELTDEVVRAHTRAFLAVCDVGTEIRIGRDLRESSPHMAAVVAAEIRASGRDSVDCGALPTPALALAAAGQGAVMVTGSHIPADRNGLKFYTRSGEITKADEAAITGALGGPPPDGPAGADRADPGAGRRFVDRYVTAFGPGALAGRRIGLHAHSAVGRDLLAECLRRLGAEVREFDRSEVFVPVDTEAVDPGTRLRLADWAAADSLDAVVSTDGDSDRPMLTDETGRIVPGDILGQITADLLGADTVVTPISSNSGVQRKGFGRVILTRIGSPFVIAGMEEAGGRVIGYEANGGTLLGFEAAGPAGPLPPLPTRDSFLPIIAALVAARGGPVSARVAAEPPRFTATDRLQGISPETSAAFLSGLSGAARAGFLDFAGAPEVAEDRTDGLRLTLADGSVVHLRPSGNAPEFRFYAEADSSERAADLLARGLDALRTRLAGPSR